MTLFFGWTFRGDRLYVYNADVPFSGQRGELAGEGRPDLRRHLGPSRTEARGSAPYGGQPNEGRSVGEAGEKSANQDVEFTLEHYRRTGR